MGERVKDVYVTWERCEKEVYVMMDVKKNVYVMGERGGEYLCDEREGGGKYLCDRRYEKEVYVMREI